MTCLLKNGCPCTADCPRHGNCAECIRHHFEESTAPTTCMSMKMGNFAPKEPDSGKKPQ